MGHRRHIRLTLYSYLMISFIVIALIMFATNVAFYGTGISELSRHSIEQLESNVAVFERWLSNQFTQISLYMRGFFLRPEIKVIENEETPPWEFYEAVTDLQDMINLTGSNCNLIYNTHIIMASQKKVLGADRIEKSELSDSYRRVTSQSPLKKYTLYNEEGVLFLVDSANSFRRDIDLERDTTVICVELDQEALENYIWTYLGPNFRYIRLLDGNGSVIYEKRAQESINDDKLHVISTELVGTLYELELGLVPTVQDRSIVKTNIIMVSCLLLIVLSGIMFRWATRCFIHRPILNIISAFDSIDKGSYDDITIPSSSNLFEFSYLYDAIRGIVDKIRDNMKTNYEQKLKLKETELRQYQLQIDPHFLYNGFYNIQRMCSNGHVEKAAELSKKLAMYYRHITRKGINFVPLEDEIQHAMLYIDIQTIRFNNRIKVSRDYDVSQLPKLSVPSLIFQPLIENVYEHAFNTMSAEVFMAISMDWNENAQIFTFTVEDSGDGMTEEVMRKMNQRLNSDQMYDAWSGILNVSRRLRLYFGESSGLRYFNSTKLGGLKAVMTINIDNMEERSEL